MKNFLALTRIVCAVGILVMLISNALSSPHSVFAQDVEPKFSSPFGDSLPLGDYSTRYFNGSPVVAGEKIVGYLHWVDNGVNIPGIDLSKGYGAKVYNTCPEGGFVYSGTDGHNIGSGSATYAKIVCTNSAQQPTGWGPLFFHMLSVETAGTWVQAGGYIGTQSNHIHYALQAPESTSCEKWLIGSRWWVDPSICNYSGQQSAAPPQNSEAGGGKADSSASQLQFGTPEDALSETIDIVFGIPVDQSVAATQSPPAADQVEPTYYVKKPLPLIKYFILTIAGLIFLLGAICLLSNAGTIKAVGGLIVLVSAIIFSLVMIFSTSIQQASAQELPLGEPPQIMALELDPIELTPEPNTSGSSPPSSEGCPQLATWPMSIQQWCSYMQEASVENGVDIHLIAAVMLQESGGQPDAYSKSGAVGLLQVMPRDGLAASFMCVNGPCFAARPSTEELYDPQFNVAYGTRMLGGLISRHGNVRDALKSYGPMNYGYRYADIVLNHYAQYAPSKGE